MEERNMQLDDDGKIKMRKNREDFLAESRASAEEDEIIIDVPDFAQFKEEDDSVGLSEEELSEKNELYEQYITVKKEEAEKILEEAERLFREGEAEAAGEKFLDSAAVYGGNWRAWFGVVRVQTKDLTDFSDIYACQNAYNRALKRAGKAGKAELMQKYGEQLRVKIQENETRAQKLQEEDELYRSSKRDGLSAALKKSIKPLILSTLFFLAALIAGIVLSSLINSVSGIQILVPAIIVDALAVVLFVIALVCLRNFYSARYNWRKNESSLSTEEGRRAAELIAENDLIQSVIDDFND